jgi:drug/metabolite transporter (DMT)-like permease
MENATSSNRNRAVFWLVATTAVWALSFPLVKTLHLRHEHADDTWLLSCWTLVIRCLVTALLLIMFQPRMIRGITTAEWKQGLGLTFFGGFGLLFQADGLASTDASTSAFLTQFYCVLLPLWACLMHRRWPSRKILVCTLLVLVGMGILSGINLRTMHLGTGEWKTLLAATFFTGQILLLERPAFAQNRSITITILCMAGTGFLAAAFAVPATQDWGGFFQRFMAPADLGIMAVLTLGCTLFSYGMMNHWQRHVSATEAGLIYCMEPVFASVFVLFLPSLLGKWAGVTYHNESLTTAMLVGGGLVTMANLLLQIPERKKVSVNL